MSQRPMEAALHQYVILQVIVRDCEDNRLVPVIFHNKGGQSNFLPTGGQKPRGPIDDSLVTSIQILNVGIVGEVARAEETQPMHRDVGLLDLPHREGEAVCRAHEVPRLSRKVFDLPKTINADVPSLLAPDEVTRNVGSRSVNEYKETLENFFHL